jgi:hypothetical protein
MRAICYMLSRVLHFLKDEDHVNDSSNLEALLFWGGGGPVRSLSSHMPIDRPATKGTFDMSQKGWSRLLAAGDCV